MCDAAKLNFGHCSGQHQVKEHNGALWCHSIVWRHLETNNYQNLMSLGALPLKVHKWQSWL